MADLHFVSEKNEGKISKRATTNATKRNKRKSLVTCSLKLPYVVVVQVIKAKICTYAPLDVFRALVRILNLPTFFWPFFFALLFIIFLLTKKTICQFKPPNNASQTLASPFFLDLTTLLIFDVFFQLIETIFCKFLLWFVINPCLKRSSILWSLRWMAWKRIFMRCGQILIDTQISSLSVN